MTGLAEQIDETVAFLGERGVDRPVATIVLGSGLSGAVRLEDLMVVEKEGARNLNKLPNVLEV